MPADRPRDPQPAPAGSTPVDATRGRVLAAVLCDRHGTPAVVPAAASCRAGCAACCIAPSISSPIPGMPEGKPAGVPCVQLDDALRCRLFGQPGRPAVCASLRPDNEMCGASREHALAHLEALEQATSPG